MALIIPKILELISCQFCILRQVREMTLDNSRKKRIAAAAIGAIVLLLGAFAPTGAQAAVVQLRAVAEVIDPATLDFQRLLAGARGEATGNRAASPDAQQAGAEVKLVATAGGTWLTIDYD
jgi:hypothetical protein